MTRHNNRNEHHHGSVSGTMRVLTGRVRKTIHEKTDGTRQTARGKASKTKPVRAEARERVLEHVEGAIRAEIPKRVELQLTKLRSQAPEGPEWLHEVKFDGYRMLCRIESGTASLFTRQQLDWTSRFPEIARGLVALPATSAWIDGEIVELQPDGTSSFQLLQKSFRQKATGQLRYCVFDLLYLDGYDLRLAKLSDRKRLLHELVSPDAPERIQYVDDVKGQGKEFFEQCCKVGLEGAICKRINQPYRAGRSGDWIKVKCKHREDFVIGGYVDPRSHRRGIGALLLGSYGADGALYFEGRVGTGFTADAERDLVKRLNQLTSTACPFNTIPPPEGARRRHWALPELVASVEFTERTDAGLLRHPSFQGVREDLEASSIVRERPMDESKKAASLTR